MSSASRWRYRAANADGAAVSGEIDARSEQDAIESLRRQSLWVVDLSRSESVTRTASTPALRWGRANVDVELATAMRAIATLLAAGVPLVRTLTYAEQNGSTPALRDTFASVRAAVQRGESLSSAMATQPLFPGVFTPLVSAGEASGTLDASLSLLADHLEERVALRQQLRSALLYPVILGIASIVGVLVILLVVVPRFAALIADSGGMLPMSTRALLAISTVVTKGWWVLLLVAAGVALLVDRVQRDAAWRAAFDAQRLAWPVWGDLERLREAAGYTVTLSVALRSGVSLLSAMALARAVVRNRALQTALASAEGRVRGGERLAVALHGTLPPLAEQLIEAGETSGDLAGMSGRAAQSANDAVKRALTRAMTLVEPVLILGFGGVVGFVALALLQAIYGLNASVL